MISDFKNILGVKIFTKKFLFPKKAHIQGFKKIFYLELF